MSKKLLASLLVLVIFIFMATYLSAQGPVKDHSKIK